MLPSSLITNAITNLFYSSFLFLYFLLSLFYSLKKKRHFLSFFVVWAFFLILLDQLLAAVAHYFYYGETAMQVKILWIAISSVAFFLNYCFLYAMEMPLGIKRGVLALNFLFNAYFIYQTVLIERANFAWMALSGLVTFVTLACYAKGWTKGGVYPHFNSECRVDCFASNS